MKPIFISARLWRDSTGNTYHSVCVYFPNGENRTQTYVYGFDTAWMETARQVIEKYSGTWYGSEFNTIPAEVVNVAKRRDLHDQGRR